MNLIRLLQGSAQPEVDLTRTYDAIVIGSGAAGGMAAHVLTAQGMKVLMLEAGKKLDINKELKSLEWPYDHPRRGDMPPGHHALSLNEYTIRQPPYAAGSSYPEGVLVSTRMGRRRLLEEHRRRREGASVHGYRLCVGPGTVPGRQDEHLGAAGASGTVPDPRIVGTRVRMLLLVDDDVLRVVGAAPSLYVRVHLGVAGAAAVAGADGSCIR